MGKSSLREWSQVSSRRISCRSCWEIIPLITALVLGLSTSTWADSSAEQQKRLEAHYALEKPEGSGPFPAVMMVPVCYGFSGSYWKDHYGNTAKKLKHQGFVVLKVDFLSARGRNDCGEVDAEEATLDVVTAAKYLRGQSFVKAKAINVIGWSYGGDIALAALSKGDNPLIAPVDAVVAFYPWTDTASPWKVDVTVLILCGAKDTIAPPAKIESLLSKVPARQNVKYLVYPDTYHHFCNSSLPAEMKTFHGTIGYNEKAAKAAWEEVERFLRR